MQQCGVSCDDSSKGARVRRRSNRTFCGLLTMQSIPRPAVVFCCHSETHVAPRSCDMSTCKHIKAVAALLASPHQLPTHLRLVCSSLQLSAARGLQARSASHPAQLVGRGSPSVHLGAHSGHKSGGATRHVFVCHDIPSRVEEPAIDADKTRLGRNGRGRGNYTTKNTLGWRIKVAVCTHRDLRNVEFGPMDTTIC